MDASTFPISLTYHLVFALIAGIFFLVQFIRLRRPYQLLLAIGILASLLIHVGDPHNKVWFNTIGLFELVILVGAVVLSVAAPAAVSLWTAFAGSGNWWSMTSPPRNSWRSVWAMPMQCCATKRPSRRNCLTSVRTCAMWASVPQGITILILLRRRRTA